MRSTTTEAPSTTIASIGNGDFTVDGSLETGYPLVMLDTETITAATAARLATSLLGHVLFLKNQVPLPVVQLARISSAKTNPRTLRQRQDLLNSFDTISSHFETTFSALSTALARSRSGGDPLPAGRGFLAFLLGPGIRTAKERVILGVDGLEKQIWGSRDDLCVGDNERPDSVDNADTNEEDDGEESDEGAEEPDDSEEEEDPDEVDSADLDSDLESPHGLVDPMPPHVSRAAEEKFLQNADRLLSRVLGNADANGKGMSSEIAPTQTHVLIRAPRRFVHPAWIPCQTAGAFLDGLLDEFLSGQRRDPDPPNHRRSKGRQKVEGVWVTARTGIQRSPSCSALSSQEKKSSARDEEDDDLIWWSWDGKLLGFADW